MRRKLESGAAWISGRVDAAPASVPPRQIPSRARRPGQRHVVDPRGAPGLAAQQPRQRHPAAAPQSEPLDRLVAIDRTGRQMAAIVADQRRQRVPVDPDQGAPGVARQPREPRWRSRDNAVTVNASWAACCDPGRGLRGSMAGNRIIAVIVPHFEKYQWLGARCSKGPMDDEVRRGYPFHNARVTESLAVELGPLPLLVLGLRGRNQIEAREVAGISRLGAAWRRRLVYRIVRASPRPAVRRMPAPPSKNANCRCSSAGSPASRIAAAGSARSASSPSDSPRDFDEFARGRDLDGATIVLDSSGGSVNDSIALGRRWRDLGLLSTVGISVQTHTAQGDRASVDARSLLRVDVRVPAAVGQDALRARGGACPGAPDLDGRPRRRCQGRELQRAGPDDRRARHRAARQIHLRHGRRRRPFVAVAERAAVGRPARTVAR